MPKSLEKMLQGYLVSQVPLAKGIVAQQKLSLKQTVKLMQEKKTGSVITMKDDVVTGIFTERDLLVKVMDEKVNWDDEISNFTTPTPVTMNGDEPLRKALFLMRKKNFRHIPVFSKDKKFLGVLSIRNIIRLLAEHFPADVMNLPPRLNKFPTTVEGG